MSTGSNEPTKKHKTLAKNNMIEEAIAGAQEVLNELKSKLEYATLPDVSPPTDEAVEAKEEENSDMNMFLNQHLRQINNLTTNIKRLLERVDF